MSEEPEGLQKHIPVRLGDLLLDWGEEARQAHEAYTTGQPRGPVTGLPKLDAQHGGFMAPGYHLIHGKPGSGKTALALQIAATCGCPALYVTCEMSPMELLRRITARVTGTFLGRFRTGELHPGEALRLAIAAIEATPDLWLLDATGCYPYRADIEENARRVRGDAPHVLVVVDSVHSWAQNAPGGCTEYESLNEHIPALTSMALALDAPVLATGERNRASMARGGLDAGAGSRKLEYGAVTVMDLEREDDAGTPGAPMPVTLKLPKNRNNSPGGKVRLLFNGALQHFTEDWNPD